jgi:hypothetical protein
MGGIKLIYFGFLLISFILSVFAARTKDKSLLVFPFLIFLSILTEVLVYTLHNYKLYYNIIYHIYVPLEYVLISSYFILNSKNLITKKIITYSIPVYILICLSLSIQSSFQKHPGLQINLEGLLLITWSVITLFSIEVKMNTIITSLPVFWICVALLIYHSGIFTFTGIYNYISENKSLLGNKLNLYIIQMSNYLLYICLSIAFICSLRTKK